MQNVTLLIGIAFSILTLTLRPAYALGAFITSLLWYPSWLRFSVGTIDISAGRIVVFVLLLRCLLDKRITDKFIWSRLDTWVTLSMVVYVGVNLITLPLSVALENRAGYVMDTWFAYMVARLIITDKATIISVLKFVSIALMPLAILGIIESSTGWQPFVGLKRFCPWWTTMMDRWDSASEARMGLYRAFGPITHPIKFGCAQVMFIPLVFCLRHQRGNWRFFAYVATGFVLLGTLSSMSSGPWLMAIMAIFCLIMERYKAWVKPMIIFFIISCGIVQVISNRNIHHVIASYASVIGGAGAHRAKLIDLAAEHFDEWWALGYKGLDPGWGPALGMAFTDVTNMFVLNGVYYGILGVIALCVVLVVGLRIVIRLHNCSDNPQLKAWAWGLGSWFIIVIAGFSSVGFSGQVETLFYIILGMVGSSAYLTRAFPKMAISKAQ